MLNKLKALLVLEEQSARLTEAKPDPKVAVCAVLLEVARADQDFDPAERRTIVTVLRRQFELSEAEVEELIAATEAERSGTPDLWPFTNALRRVFSPDEKLDLLVMVWQVVFADEVLDAHEDLLVRKLTTMLSVNHSVVMEAKRRARESGPVA